MKGLIVKCKRDIFRAGIPNNEVSLMVNLIQYNVAFWHIGGFNLHENKHITWKEDMLEVGDEIEIQFAEFDNATPILAMDNNENNLNNIEKMVEDIDDYWSRKLKTYYLLKKALGE